ncbi:MAG: LssY C-terminal domain-containing protein [Gammaproteobacteria bacterium]|nr:LssY C-terminal domain-containing protein [Gammaproteobacteria bacterium]
MLCLALLAGACATSFERPAPFDDTALRARAKTIEEQGVRVSVAVPSAAENEAIFGIDLHGKNIEPVWLEIENRSPRPVWFLPTGLDPNYFAPREVAFGYHTWFADDANSALDEHLERLGFQSPIRVGETVSGYVFTNAEKVAKVITIDLISRSWANTMTMVVPIPGFELGADRLRRIAGELPPGAMAAGSESELRALLEKLPCCVTSKDGAPGEPLNVVLIGTISTAGPALQRRSYRYAPVAPRYLFGREQDISGHKMSGWIPGQPTVVRLWQTDVHFHGQPVWAGQVSMPLGGRFAGDTADGAAGPIEPDVDAARNDLVQDLLYSQMVVRLGFVEGVGAAKPASARTTPGGGSYFTDGLRAVFLFGHGNIPLSEIEFFDWERLSDHRQ